jgi:hypothetical protein
MRRRTGGRSVVIGVRERRVGEDSPREVGTYEDWSVGSIEDAEPG